MLLGSCLKHQKDMYISFCDESTHMVVEDFKDQLLIVQSA